MVWHPGGDHFYVNTVKGATGAWRYDAATLDGQPMGLASVWLAPGGRWLMATDEAGVWQVLALDDERLIRGDLHNLTFSPDGRWATAAMGADQPIELLDGETLETVGVLPYESGEGMRWKPDGKGWFTPAEAGTVQLWWVGAGGDIQAGEPGEEMRWVWHPSDDRLMQYNPQGAATVYDSATGDITATFHNNQPSLSYEGNVVWFMNWTQDGRNYLIAYNNMGGAYSFVHTDSETGDILHSFSGDSPIPPQYTPDGQKLVYQTGVYDANTHERLYDIPSDIAHISPDGQRLFTSFISFVNLQVYDLNTGALLFDHERYPDRLRQSQPNGGYRGWWSPDSTRLLAQDETNGLWLYDAATGALLARQAGHVVYGNFISYSPDSSIVAVANDLNDVSLYDTETGEPMRGLVAQPHTDPIFQMEWHPESNYFALTTRGYQTIANSSEHMTVFIWGRNGELVTTINHPSRADAILWASDGSYLLSASNRHLTRWYTSRERQPRLQTWDDGFGTFASPSFSPDEGFLVVMSSISTQSSGMIIRNAQTFERLSNQMHISRQSWSWTADSRQIRAVGIRCEAYMPPSGCQIAFFMLFDADAPIEVAQTPYPEQIHPEPVYSFGAYEPQTILLWSPDGSKVAALDDGRADVWAVGSEQAELMDTYLLGESDRFQWGEDSTPQIVRPRDTGTFRPVFSPDGRTYITTEGGVLRMYRVGASD